jgi:hypothetical protein
VVQIDYQKLTSKNWLSKKHCHPERSRSSGVVKDLLFNRPIALAKQRRCPPQKFLANRLAHGKTLRPAL